MIISALYEQEPNKYHLSRGKVRHDQTHELVIRDREEVDGQWVRRQQIVKDFRPYCYVVWNKSLQLQDRKRDVMRPLTPVMATDDFRVERVIVDSGQKNADGDKLGKIIFKSPEDLRMWRYNHSYTFEADVPYEDRYLVDNVSEIKPYKMRKLFLDLEALQYTKDDGPILCKNSNNPRDNQMINVIGVYDSYTKTRMQWCQHENLEEDVQIKYNCVGYGLL
jgi:DNA polymerase elongation subunit (family B)